MHNTSIPVLRSPSTRDPVIIINFIFCSNIIYFCSVKLDFSIRQFNIRNPASKSLQSIEISLYLAFTNELNVAQKEKNIDE